MTDILPPTRRARAVRLLKRIAFSPPVLFAARKAAESKKAIGAFLTVIFLRELAGRLHVNVPPAIMQQLIEASIVSASVWLLRNRPKPYNEAD